MRASVTVLPIQFSLRSLFLLPVIVAGVSELLRCAFGARESPFLFGLAYFGFGGTAALLTFAFLAMMAVAASQSPAIQRMGICARFLIA